MSKTLIIGCGELGIPLGLQLIERGHQVTGLRRNIHKLPSSIKGVSLDLAQALPEKEWLEQFGLIYIILTPAERSETAYRNLYEHTIPQLMHRIAEGQTTQRIILTSSSHVYAASEGEEVDENTPTEAYDYRSAALIATEKSLAQLHQRAQSKQAVCVRFSGLYTENSSYVFQQVHQKKPISNPEHYMNRLHREDAVGFLRHLAELQQVKTLYLASDNCPVQRKVFFQAIADKLSKEVYFEDNPQVGGKQCLNQRLKDSGYLLTYPSYIEGYQL